MVCSLHLNRIQAMHDLWEVFLTPHTDDEVLGMAGAITRANLSGIKTCVVLVTDNQPSSRMKGYFSSIPDLAEERRIEWRNAMQCLGVHELREWDISEADMVPYPLGQQALIESRLEAIHHELTPFHVHSVVGSDDQHAEVGYGALSHLICANAVAAYADRHRDTRVSLHGVYVYSKPSDDRNQCGSLKLRRDELSKREMEKKREAMLHYRAGIGYGYRSVPELFDAAALDPHEYTIELMLNAEVTA